MFNENKYKNWYFSIILNAQNRSIPLGYVEKHHIIPKSMNGSNLPDNIVKLTAREHFICHHLLTKMTNGDAKRRMYRALSFFLTGNKNHTRKLTARQYSIARQAAFEGMKGTVPGPACREACIKARTGAVTPEHIKDRIRKKLEVQHQVFVFDRAQYFSHPDFYRFCKEQKIARGNAQRKMKDGGIAVITNGVHKGKALSFVDVGSDRMIEAIKKECALATQRRSASITEVHKKQKDRKVARVKIVMLNKDGIEFKFNSLGETSQYGTPTSLQNVKNKLPYKFLHGSWQGWTLLSYHKY